MYTSQATSRKLTNQPSQPFTLADGRRRMLKPVLRRPSSNALSEQSVPCVPSLIRSQRVPSSVQHDVMADHTELLTSLTPWSSRHLFNKRLIAEVRKRPCLWHRDHMNRVTSITSANRFAVRGALEKWDELGAVFGLSGEMVRKRWRYHRDSFTKKWRSLFGKLTVDIETARAVPADKQWPYYKDLLFVFEKDPLLESDDEEMTDGSANGDAVTLASKETTDDTTCSGDAEPTEQTEASEEYGHPVEDSAGAVEVSTTVESLAESTNNEDINTELLSENTNNGDASSVYAVEPSPREEVVVSTGGNMGPLILLQSPIENTIVSTITFGPAVNWSNSGVKRRRLLPKGGVMPDTQSMRDDLSVSNLTNGPSVPFNGLSLPVIRLSLPANGPSMLVNGLNLPVITLPQPAVAPLLPVSESLVAVSEPSLPFDGPSLPVDEPLQSPSGPSLPISEPSLPAKEPSLPAKEPSLPAKRPSLPAKKPSQPPEGPLLPIDGPSLPVHRPLPQSSSPESNEPVFESSLTVPDETDHIGHFLCSLERYVRKTAEETQPQLMMELLNVASSYCENLYPMLLFPRT